MQETGCKAVSPFLFLIVSMWILILVIGPWVDCSVSSHEKHLRTKQPEHLSTATSEVKNDPSLILEIALATLATVKVEVSPQIVDLSRAEGNRT